MITAYYICEATLRLHSRGSPSPVSPRGGIKEPLYQPQRFLQQGFAADGIPFNFAVVELSQHFRCHVLISG